MRPLHRGSEEKLKRLFQEKKVPQENRALWPVLTSGDLGGLGQGVRGCRGICGY